MAPIGLRRACLQPSTLRLLLLSAALIASAASLPRKAGLAGETTPPSFVAGVSPGFPQQAVHKSTYNGTYARRHLSQASVSGYDVVIVAGQSNAVGNSVTPDPTSSKNDATAGLPIYVLQMGVDSQHGGSPGWTGPGGVNFQAADENVYHISSTSGGGINDFSVTFAKDYVAGGFLASGRGLMIVNTGWVGEGFEFAPSTPYNWPAPGATTLVLCWAANSQCNSAVSGVSFATAATQTSPIKMSLFTHAQYRVDMALSINPSTGQAPSSGSLAPNSANKVVAVLWHEGELDVEGGFPVAAWAGCLESIISAWRARYGSSIPLIVGTFTYAQQRNPAAYYTDYMRYQFGQGRYGVPPGGPDAPAGPGIAYSYEVIQSVSNMPTSFSGMSNLGLADSWYSAPAAGGLAYNVAPYDLATTIHFSVYGLQVMGSRYAAAYAQLVGGGTQQGEPPAPAAIVTSPQLASGASQRASPIPGATLVFSHRVSATYNAAEYFNYGADVLHSPNGDTNAATHMARRRSANDQRAFLVSDTPLRTSQYSILDQLDNIKRPDGLFELYFVDSFGPNADGVNYNHWVQSSNPATTRVATGYAPISLSFPTGTQPFAGLSLFNPASGYDFRCTFCGQQDSSALAFGVGQFGVACPTSPFIGYNGKPGIASGGGASTTWVQLYSVTSASSAGAPRPSPPPTTVSTSPPSPPASAVAGYIVTDVSPLAINLAPGGCCGAATSPACYPAPGLYGNGASLGFAGVYATAPSSISKLNFNFFASSGFIEFWAQFGSAGTAGSGGLSYPGIISRGLGFTTTTEWIVATSPGASGSNTPSFTATTSSPGAAKASYQEIDAVALPDDGNWHHVAFSYNSSTAVLTAAVDGAQLVRALLGSVPPFDASAPTQLLFGSFVGGAVVAELRVVTGVTSALPYANSYAVPTAPVGLYSGGTTALLLRCAPPGTAAGGAPPSVASPPPAVAAPPPAAPPPAVSPPAVSPPAVSPPAVSPPTSGSPPPSASPPNASATANATSPPPSAGVPPPPLLPPPSANATAGNSSAPPPAAAAPPPATANATAGNGSSSNSTPPPTAAFPPPASANATVGNGSSTPPPAAAFPPPASANATVGNGSSTPPPTAVAPPPSNANVTGGNSSSSNSSGSSPPPAAGAPPPGANASHPPPSPPAGATPPPSNASAPPSNSTAPPPATNATLPPGSVASPPPPLPPSSAANVTTGGNSSGPPAAALSPPPAPANTTGGNASSATPAPPTANVTVNSTANATGSGALPAPSPPLPPLPPLPVANTTGNTTVVLTLPGVASVTPATAATVASNVAAALGVSPSLATAVATPGNVSATLLFAASNPLAWSPNAISTAAAFFATALGVPVASISFGPAAATPGGFVAVPMGVCCFATPAAEAAAAAALPAAAANTTLAIDLAVAGFGSSNGLAARSTAVGVASSTSISVTLAAGVPASPAVVGELVSAAQAVTAPLLGTGGLVTSSTVQPPPPPAPPPVAPPPAPALPPGASASPPPPAGAGTGGNATTSPPSASPPPPTSARISPSATPSPPPGAADGATSGAANGGGSSSSHPLLNRTAIILIAVLCGAFVLAVCGVCIGVCLKGRAARHAGRGATVVKVGAAGAAPVVLPPHVGTSVHEV